jgi:hypothetical protein
MKGSEAERRAYASEMLVQGERHFIKLPSSNKESEDGRATPRPRPRRSRQPAT